MCLRAANRAEQAIAVIHDIKQYLPNEIYIINSFANLALSMMQSTLAIDISTKYQTNDLQTHFITAKAHMQLENWSAAILMWNKLSEKAPTQPEVYKNKSLCYAKTREYEQAISAFASFINYAKQDSLNYLKFADLYILARDIKNARKQLEHAISLKDCSLIRYEIEIRVCRFEHNQELALIAAEKAINLSPYNYIAWGAKQEIGDQNTNTIAHLAQLLNLSLANNYENQQNLFILAKAYEKDAQYQLAFRCFDKANKMQEEVIKDSKLSYDYSDASSHAQFLKQVFFSFKKTEQSTPKNIFIVGMPRSGTTLIDRILSQHPNIKSSGENDALAHFIENKIIQQKNANDKNWEEFFNQNRKDFQRLYNEKTALNSEIIVDKMPHNFRYVGAILSVFDDAKVIQMRRTPEDLALSIFSQPFAPHHNYAANLKHIAHAIFQANKLMDFWSEQFPDNVIDVNYNQLTNSPINIASEVYKFCRLDWKDEYLSFHKTHVNSFTFSELQVRKPINTDKQNFARHYKKELAIFRGFYQELSQSKC
jgi:tetratricopeptide (TPR) repeat protein